MSGKFLNEESLIKSYENLEREFTKKCQELSRLKKEISESEIKKDENVKNKEDSQQKVDEALIEAVEEVEEKIEKEQDEASGNGEDVTLEKKNEDSIQTEKVKTIISRSVAEKLKKGAEELFEKYPESVNLKKEITQELLNSRELLSHQSPFYLAYLIVKDKMKLKEKPIKNEEKQDKISAEDVFPAIMGGSKGGFSSPAKKKYSSFEDARGDLISRYFS